MGKILVRRILSGEKGVPEKVIILSRDEAKQYDMRASYMQEVVSEDTSVYQNFERMLEFRIGDVKNYADVVSAIRGVHIVINAAALKQVPTCEYFPYQGILTNCMGAQNIVRAIGEHEFPVEVVVGISTDKAARPVNVMGMTKAVQERIFTSANIFIKKTRFCCVRYGNVMASRGSVIPLFHRQMAVGGPITVTDPQMTRFFINLSQAVDVVFSAIEQAQQGEIFIPIIPSSTVDNIAKALVGGRDIDIQVRGIRPGEKKHEILISEEEITRTIKRGEYYVIKSMLPELGGGVIKGPNLLTREYSSADHLLDLQETVQLLKKNNLLEVDLTREREGELLR